MTPTLTLLTEIDALSDPDLNTDLNSCELYQTEPETVQRDLDSVTPFLTLTYISASVRDGVSRDVLGERVGGVRCCSRAQETGEEGRWGGEGEGGEGENGWEVYDAVAELKRQVRGGRGRGRRRGGEIGGRGEGTGGTVTDCEEGFLCSREGGKSEGGRVERTGGRGDGMEWAELRGEGKGWERECRSGLGRECGWVGSVRCCCGAKQSRVGRVTFGFGAGSDKGVTPPPP